MDFYGLTEHYLQRDLNLSIEQEKVRSELMLLLPSTIIDIHTHHGLFSNIERCEESIYNSLCSTYPYFTFSDHNEANEILFNKEKKIKQVAFPFPFDGRNHKSSNDYIKKLAIENKDSIIPFLMGDINDIPYTNDQLKSGFWKGLKMYHMQSDRKVEKITDFFPIEVLDVVNELKLPIILHLPNDLLGDEKELLLLLDKYKDMKFVIAHMGNTVFLNDEKLTNLEMSLQKLKGYDNLYFDLSWFFNEKIMKLFINNIGHNKILYGSDQPLNLLSCQFVFNEDLRETRALSKYPYHRANEKERSKYLQQMNCNDSNMEMIHFMQLKSIVAALGGDKNKIADFFFNNAKNVLDIS